MMRIFYGDDRVRAQKEIKRILGDDYEIVEGAELEINDLPSVFMGASLLAETRHILIRDITANKLVFDELPKYLNTPHEVVILEAKLDKRSTTYKALKDKVEIREFALPENTDFRQVFDVYRAAKTDGKRALQILEKIKPYEDPIQFTGLIVSQAIKDFATRPSGVRERRILKELAKVDLDMKSTKIDPWLLVESFLLRLSSF